jgi:hypothetical protein
MKRPVRVFVCIAACVCEHVLWRFNRNAATLAALIAGVLLLAYCLAWLLAQIDEAFERLTDENLRDLFKRFTDEDGQ